MSFAKTTVFAWSKILDKVEVTDSIGAMRVRTNGIGDAQAYQFQHTDREGRFDPSVLLSLDYWVLVPRKRG